MDIRYFISSLLFRCGEEMVFCMLSISFQLEKILILGTVKQSAWLFGEQCSSIQADSSRQW